MLLFQSAIVGSLPWTVLLFPFIFIPFMAFLIGMAWFLCALGAFTRDAGYLMINIVPLFMFATPVFYPHTALSPPWDFWIYANALTGYVEVMRDIVLVGELAQSAGLSSGRCSPRSSRSTSATGSSTGIGMSLSTSSDIVVQTRHLGKAYQLYARRNDWLKQVMFGWWKSYFKPFWVLRDIDLEVRRGESIGILGRNGCGKSTLLQVICGMTLPSHGELRVTGRIAPVLALGATFDLELSGRENVMIGGAVLGLKRSEVLRKFELHRRVRRHRRLHGPAGEALLDGHAHPARLLHLRPRRGRDPGGRRGAGGRRCRLPAQVPRLDRQFPSSPARCCSSPIRWPRSAACARARSGSRTAASASRAIPSEVIRNYHRALLVEKDDVHRFSASG